MSVFAVRVNPIVCRWERVILIDTGKAPECGPLAPERVPSMLGPYMNFSIFRITGRLCRLLR